MKMQSSGYAALDVIRGRRTLEKRLRRGERIKVIIHAEIDPDFRGHSDDGTSTQFTLIDVKWREKKSAL